MPAFRYEPHANPYISSISDLLQAPGQIEARRAEQVGAAQAQAALQSGQAWAGAAQGVGNAVGGAIQQATDPRRQLIEAEVARTKQQNEAGTRALAMNATVNQLMQTSMVTQPDGSVIFDRGKLRNAFTQANIPIPLQEQTFKSLDEVDASMSKFATARTDSLADIANGALKNGPTPEALLFGIALAKANHRLTDQELAPLIHLAASGGDLKAALMQVRDMSEKYKTKFGHAPEGSTLFNEATGEQVGTTPGDTSKGDYTINGQRFNKSGQPIGAIQPTQAAPKSLQTKSVLLDGKPAEVVFDPASGKFQDASGADVSAHVKPIPLAAQANIFQTGTDAKSIADAIVAGDQPPDVKGLYRMAGPVRAELARQGYDLSKANLDWTATQKHLSTLNGAQQTRLRQAVATASDSLGVIEDLAKQWGGGKFPLLNRATLAAAKGGALGPQAQQIATNLQAQISDVTSELGNVYMGGNSPTDHALGLAAKNLSADWTKDQLLSAIKLARTNLQIRSNSITSLGPVLSDSATQPTGAGAVKVGGFTIKVKP